MATKPIAIIAGGGSGIGRGCALKLASLSYEVILVGRTQSKLDLVAKEITNAGGDARTFAADVRDWEKMEELGRETVEGGIDMLINCAGGQFAKASAELSQNGWQAVVETNLSGSFFLCRHLYSALRKRKGSAIMVVANIWQKGAPLFAHSGAARAGVVNLTRTLAKEWASEGIRINAVSPGLTETKALLDQHLTLVETVPLGRIGSVEEVVDAILFMAQASYITGEVLTIDGGLNLN